MAKLEIALITATLIFATLSIYLYDELTKAEMRYELLKKEYTTLAEEINSLREKSQLTQEKLENYTKTVDELRRDNRRLMSEVKLLKYVISTNPERWEVELAGDVDSRLERIKEVIDDSLTSDIVAAYAEMFTVGDAIYLNGQKFSFDYLEDERVFNKRDAVVNPEWFLLHRVGDCDDVATAMAVILKLKGYDVQFCVGHREGDNGGSKHAWVRIDRGDVDYRYCVNRVCKMEVGNFGDIAEKCIKI
ncbi:transglutaminase-like domain-containing protein [Archaeoglobus neptunius]|uniref:transglutaminase-like domain-containing protein n=1 Tax=Archaeoglobus neptunius TaxID=2798580 RepID=UPI0019280C5C|nr:transglutaminase domain-containing protein [Archaeoglobus neptunius]